MYLLLMLGFLSLADAVCLPTVNTTLCPNLQGISKPSTLVFESLTSPDPDAFYTALSHLLCTNCSSSAGSDYLCSLIYYYYQPCSNSSQMIQLPCRRDCQASNLACGNAYNYNSTYANEYFLNCVALISDTNCVSSSSGNVCAPPPFLLRKSAHVYNYIWIFVIGVGGFVLLLILAAVLVYFCVDVDTLRTWIDPCRWCECCPHYYDV
jgi:hypothetical protein